MTNRLRNLCLIALIVDSAIACANMPLPGAKQNEVDRGIYYALPRTTVAFVLSADCAEAASPETALAVCQKPGAARIEASTRASDTLYFLELPDSPAHREGLLRQMHELSLQTGAPGPPPATVPLPHLEEEQRHRLIADLKRQRVMLVSGMSRESAPDRETLDRMIAETDATIQRLERVDPIGARRYELTLDDETSDPCAADPASAPGAKPNPRTKLVGELEWRYEIIPGSIAQLVAQQRCEAGQPESYAGIFTRVPQAVRFEVWVGDTPLLQEVIELAQLGPIVELPSSLLAGSGGGLESRRVYETVAEATAAEGPDVAAPPNPSGHRQVNAADPPDGPQPKP